MTAGGGDEISIVENSLRDLIEVILKKAYGVRWSEHLGVTDERMEQWKARRAEEPKRRPGGAVEGRLLYYADFYDAIQIIRKDWEIGFNQVFGDRKRFDVYTDRLNAFRNPGAHSRPLLPFEEHLVLGMSGELRQEITLFLSSGAGGPEPEYFPRIEEVRDSYGTRAIGEGTSGSPGDSFVESGIVLRPGDKIAFVAKAWDPEDGLLEWYIYASARWRGKLTGPVVEWEWLIEEQDISETARVSFTLMSNRPYHRHAGGGDDNVLIGYKVLPPRR